MDLSVKDKIFLTEEEKWNSVLTCDGSRDGMFFYGVRSTGIFCRPSCRSKQPLRANIQFFETMEDALSSGFRACLRCRPDLLVYDPGREMVEKLKDLYRRFFAFPEELGKDKIKPSLSETQWHRLFYRYEGCTPGQYLRKLRLAEAENKLRTGKATILQVALDCGFESLSAFYRLFKRSRGISPAQYRNQIQVQFSQTMDGAKK